ncbi:hypothetical protein M2454_001907 [Aequitasia blattaphilus]|uniref:Uncharacterized protein n=1 Tax=Aequitasia blattaphilus TaxID=2949332 RepID=A0ABT1E9U0_9FIRM|nr:hypothetical protein [Aequitasia blattaphilus]MCP1102595.1 hypothetical protein [Aequitasia blattaphilus]MCR8615235.1 hypothetical protein [Aequitasia blattaphilus]
MAIKILMEKPYIDVEIGELKFKFDKSDEHIKEFYKKLNGYQKTYHELFDETEEANEEATPEKIDALGKLLKDALDSMLEEGAYDKIYELIPSVTNIAFYFFELCLGIKKEITEDPMKAIASKYLTK